MRLLLLVGLLLSALSTKASAQQTFLPPATSQPTRHTTIYVDMSEPATWKEVTNEKMWFPLNGKYQWLRKVREHRGAGWETFAGRWRWFDDRITEDWVPEQSLQQANAQTPRQTPDKVIRHTTINVWELRRQAEAEMEAAKRNRSPAKTKVLHEPVYRVPTLPVPPSEADPAKSKTEYQSDGDGGWRSRPKPAEEKKPKSRYVQPSGPTMIVKFK